MKKPDEIRLYNTLREHSSRQVSWSHLMPEKLAHHYFEIADIHPKRGYAMLDKWVTCGWWEYGVSLRAGWFTDKAPERL